MTGQERALYLELARRLERGEPVAVATLVRAWGSTPREVGAKMLVDPEGAIAGTIGGGCGEAEVWQEARDLFTRGNRPHTVHVDLTEDIESDSGKVCGGRFDVLVERLDPGLPAARALAEAVEGGGREVALMVVLGPTERPAWKRAAPGLPPEPADPVACGGAHPSLEFMAAREEPEAEAEPDLECPEPEECRLPTGLRLVLLEPGGLLGTLGDREADRHACQQAREALRQEKARVVSLEVRGVPHDLFIDPLAAPPELVIAGAGHIARPLCRMAAMCGYRVTVVDDRPEFADRRWFPEAAEVVCRPFAEAFEALQVTPRTHVVLVTRGHKHDEECLRRMIGQEPAYLGMIGSRRRTKAVFTELEAEGVDPAWLDRVHAPIGLDIGAETPEEIAVAILGEMIKLRRGGGAAGLSLRAR